MISRAQGKTLSAVMAGKRMPKLSALEKAMLKWVIVDPEDKVLDANIGNGLMAEYLRRNMQCEVCGVSDHMDSVREARSRLQNCDIVYAGPGEIPWMECAFDTVLMKYGEEEPRIFQRMLDEAARVLRPGGQLILGTFHYPAAINTLLTVLADESLEERYPFQRERVMEMLCACHFKKVTWQRTGLNTGVMIAWKAHPEADELRCSE